MTSPTFDPVPATRADGTGNPPVDMNNTSNQLAAIGAGYSVMNTVYGGGADPTGGTDSTAQIGSCIAAGHANGMPVLFPAGTFSVDEALNWKLPGLQVYGAGSSNTVILQSTSNTPILQLAGQGQTISGLRLAYPTLQGTANTSSIAIEFGDDSVGSCFMSKFSDLYVTQAQTGLAVSPSVSTAAGLFSCLFENTHVLGFSYSAINLVGNNGLGGADCTGCVFNNVYVHNNFSGTADSNSAWWPVYFQAWDELVINQINVEHAEIFDSDAVAFSSVGNAVVNSMHLEHLEVSGNPGWGFVYVSHASTAVINGLSIRFPTMTGTSYNSVIRMNGSGPSVILNGLNEPSDGGVNATHPLIDFTAATNASAVIDGIAASQTTENTQGATATTSAQIIDGTQVTYAPALKWTTFGTGGWVNILNSTSGAGKNPVAGTWYYAELYVPSTTTFTGVSAGVVSAGGTDKWVAAFWGTAGGTALAHSGTAGIVTPSTGKMLLPFASSILAPGPATYLIGIQSNGTASQIEVISNANEGFITGSVTGVFGSVPSLTPSGTYSASVGPIAATY